MFLAHAVASWTASEIQIARAAALAMQICAWFVILPLAAGTLVTGLVQALGTQWGLWRNYWVMFKLVLTVVATAVLLSKLGPIAQLGEVAAGPAFSLGDQRELRLSMVVHAAGGLVVLIAAALLAVFKPAGLTHFAGRSKEVRAPRWTKAVFWAMAVLLLFVFLMVLLGKHGPKSHSADAPVALADQARAHFNARRK